jgi:aspartyl aminopeptidase
VPVNDLTGLTTPGRAHADDLMRFVQASPTAFHAAAEAARRLSAAGFTELDLAAAWQPRAGGYYVLRGGTLIAWYLTDDALAEPSRRFRIVGSHTDSPHLRIKPRPDKGALGWRQLAVEIYGGPLLNSWLDRELGLAGRLVLRDGSEHLVNVDRPLMRVPQLAIHLDQEVGEGLRLDRQQHLTPVWGIGTPRDGELIEFLASVANLPAAEITGWDLMAYEHTPPAYLGRDEELFASPRLDNLLSSHANVSALISAVERGVPAGGAVPVAVAFDHEEIGSESDTGAASALLGAVLERIVLSRGGDPQDRTRAIADSVLLSSDVGHAVHPNYPERHDPDHHPLPNGGPILKVNASVKYATDARGRSVWTNACEAAGVPWQIFVSKNSMRCGSTIGPITAARLGVTTVDVGVALLSMHSARELGGTEDPGLLSRAMAAFFVG